MYSSGVERLIAAQMAIGSIPIASLWGCSSIGRVRALQAWGSGIETHQLHFLISWPSWLGHLFYTQKIVGSIPTEIIFFLALVV